MLTLKMIREKNLERQKEWDEGDAITLTYLGNALAGETGEACNIIKKLERERLGLNGTRSSASSLAEEFADVLTYLDLAAAKAGINLDEAYIAKFNAVSEKNGFKTRF